jgi:hypothetical protein
MNSLQISRGKTPSCLCVNARLIKHTPVRQEDFAGTGPLVPGVPHLVSGSWASPRTFGWDFLQPSPHGDALVLLLAFGSANTWHGDLHPVSAVPCPAHTPRHQPHAPARRLHAVVRLGRNLKEPYPLLQLSKRPL